VLLPLRTTRSGASRTKYAGCSDACGVLCNLECVHVLHISPNAATTHKIVSCMHCTRPLKQLIPGPNEAWRMLQRMPENICSEETVNVKTGHCKFGVCVHKHAPEQCAALEETVNVKTGPCKFGMCAHKHAPEQCAGYAARTL